MRTVVQICLCAALVGLLARPPSRRTETNGAPLLPRKELLATLAAPYLHAVADLYWIKTSHAIGKARSGPEYREAYFFADLVTDLDPDFDIAYAFAAQAIPYHLGRERWVNTREAMLLLEKGMRRFPEYIYLRILLAYNYSYFQGEHAKAAVLLDETSRMPGAPLYLARLATRLYAQSGLVDKGLALAQALVDSADDPKSREAFELRVKELELERSLQAVDAALKAFQTREGRPAASIEELLLKKDLATMPLDPFEGVIYIGEDGLAHSTSSERRLVTYGFEKK